MADLQKIRREVLADGKIDREEVELIRKELYADGEIDKDEVEFLIALRNEAKQVIPEFERLFFTSLKKNVLGDGTISAEEARWLRQTLFADGKVDENEKNFLRELKREAKKTSPEFEALYAECVK